MNYRVIIVVSLLIMGFTAKAFKEVSVPDMSKSESHIVEVHNKLLAEFKKSRPSLEGIKLGSAYGELCMFYQAHEFYKAAITCYENAIEASPFDIRWHHLLGFIKASQGDFSGASQQYQKVIEINSDYLVAKVRMAELELEQGQFDKASQYFEEVLDKAPDFSRALVGLGTISIQKGEPKKAIPYFERALALQPRANQLNFLLSQAYSAIGDAKKANEYLQSKGQQPVVMYDKILQEMRLHSESSSYYAQSAINAFLNEDYRLAESLVLHAIQLDPSNINPKFTLMNVLSATDRSDKAIELAKELFKSLSTDDRLPYSIALINEVSGNDEQAVIWYDKTLKVNNTHKTARISKANALMRLKKYNKALKVLRKSQQLDTENPYPIFAEASILSYLKVCDKAVPKYLEAIKKLSSENFTYLIAFVKTVAACHTSDEQIRADALNAARNMYRYKPTAKVTQALAMIEMEFGNKQDAIDFQAQVIFQALVDKLPKYIVDSLKEDFELYKKGKKVERALKEYDIEINPKRITKIN